LHEGGSSGKPPPGFPLAAAPWALLPHAADAAPQAFEPQTHLLSPAATRRKRTTV
jgi:hypothetical protein